MGGMYLLARPVQHIEATSQETSPCDTSKHRRFIVVYMVTCTNDLGMIFQLQKPGWWDDRPNRGSGSHALVSMLVHPSWAYLHLLGGRSVRVASVGVVCGVAYSVCRSEGKDGSDDQEPQLHIHYKPLLDWLLGCAGLEWIMGDWLF